MTGGPKVKEIMENLGKAFPYCEGIRTSMKDFKQRSNMMRFAFCIFGDIMNRLEGSLTEGRGDAKKPIAFSWLNQTGESGWAITEARGGPGKWRDFKR